MRHTDSVFELDSLVVEVQKRPVPKIGKKDPRPSQAADPRPSTPRDPRPSPPRRGPSLSPSSQAQGDPLQSVQFTDLSRELVKVLILGDDHALNNPALTEEAKEEGKIVAEALVAECTQLTDRVRKAEIMLNRRGVKPVEAHKVGSIQVRPDVSLQGEDQHLKDKLSEDDN